MKHFVEIFNTAIIKDNPSLCMTAKNKFSKNYFVSIDFFFSYITGKTTLLCLIESIYGGYHLYCECGQCRMATHTIAGEMSCHAPLKGRGIIMGWKQARLLITSIEG